MIVALGTPGVSNAASGDGSALPFPPAPSASVAQPTLQESTHQRRVEQNHLPKDAPNILIILLDDVGFGLPDTVWWPDPHAHTDAHREPGRQLQRLPYHVDLLADTRVAAHRT